MEYNISLSTNLLSFCSQCHHHSVVYSRIRLWLQAASAGVQDNP